MRALFASAGRQQAGLSRATMRATARRTTPLAMRSFSSKPESEAKADAEAEAQPADAGAQPEDAKAAEAEAPEKSEWQLKYEAKDKDAAKLKEAYQRAIADFRNLQKTTENDIQKAKQYALQKFAKDLIESVDNFDLAIHAFPKDKIDASPKEVQEFYTGVSMVQQVLEKTLARYGIVKVNPMNEKFDPNEHEALFQMPDPSKEPGTIFHVDRTGFKLHDRVLRAPKVGFVQDPDN